ncbi:hypothetical protein [Achromobacter sp. ESBL13]|uniref:hypothetical protein n=1 Tax=Achromobacter sp. ESBL13 TaxID=3077328 RepID=UPI002FC89C62
MADYVRKTILSQGYAHILNISLDAEEKTEYEVNLKTYQESRAKLMMSSSIVPEVKTKDGSLKVYATVYGSLSDALGDVSGGFMEALNSLYVSSKMLADACILEGLFLSKAARRNLVRSEARTGVVKTTKDLFDMTAGAVAAFQQDGFKKISATLEKIEQRATFLNDQFDQEKDKKLVWTYFFKAFNELPKSPTRLASSADGTQLKLYQSRLLTLQKRIAAMRDA